MEENYFEKCLNCNKKWEKCECEKCHHCGKSVDKNNLSYPFCSSFCSEGNRLGVVNPNTMDKKYEYHH